MDSLDKWLKDYDSTQFEALPSFMKRRVEALKKIQLEHINLEHQYHKELQALEMKYEALYKPLYEKRSKIINGDYEPSDEECQLPATISENLFNGDQDENKSEEKPKPFLTEVQEKELESKVKGIPGFWLGTLASSYNFNDSIEAYDKQALKYLKDIKIVYSEEDEQLKYRLDFQFDENPYFTNQVLSKTYYLKCAPDEKDPFNYEGFEVVKSAGCEIDWKPGKNITTKTVTVKQKNKADGRIRDKTKEVERDSFFHFFKPPQQTSSPDKKDADESEEDKEELNAFMAIDFELGEVIRQSIIPKAVLHYCGYLMDDDDDESMDEEFDDDDEESEDESEADSLT